MSKLLKATAAAALLACGATIAFAQTTPPAEKQAPPPKNATQPAAPEGPTAQPPASNTTPPAPGQGSGSAGMGPPAADTQGGPGMTKDKIDQKKSPN